MILPNELTNPQKLHTSLCDKFNLKTFDNRPALRIHEKSQGHEMKTDLKYTYFRVSQLCLTEI